MMFTARLFPEQPPEMLILHCQAVLQHDTVQLVSTVFSSLHISASLAIVFEKSSSHTANQIKAKSGVD